MTRIPDRLSELQTRVEELHARADQLLQALGAVGPSNAAMLAKARNLFGGWVDTPDLNRWKRMKPHAIALEILTSKRGLSRKALREQLSLGAKAVDIEEAWSGVQTYLLTRSEQIRHRIAMFPSEPDAGGEAQAPQSP